jgi:hypothetical protein
MTFKPQYSLWGKEDFSTASGATIVNTGEFGIIGGVTKLIPVVFASGTHTFNAPWDPVTGWDTTNTMDSELLVEQDFVIYTGENSSYGNIGTAYRTAYYTSGEDSSFVYDYSTGQNFDLLTLEFGARSLVATGLDDYPPYQGNNGFGPNLSHHGVYIGNESGSAFIEISPYGLNLRGVSGGFLEADYASRVVNTRIVISGDSLTMMTVDDQHMYAATGVLAFTGTYDSAGVQSGAYISFGSFALTGSGEYAGSAATGNFDYIEGTQNITGFYGKTLWDDIKIATGQAVTKLPYDYIPNYPAGVKTLYTAPWYTTNNIPQYLGAYIGYNPISGGSTTVTLQSSVPTNIMLTGGAPEFEDVSSVAPLVLTTQNEFSFFMDTSSTRAYPYPFQNGLRFKIESESLGGAAPEIDEITVLAKSTNSEMDVVPNWKMSSFSKDINFVIDEDKYTTDIPKAHHDDFIYFHNESNVESVAASGFIQPHITSEARNIVSGQVLYYTGAYSGAPPKGIVKINDGYYKDAWRNFVGTGDYAAEWYTNSFRFIGDSVFNGPLLDNLETYPTSGTSVATGTTANIVYSVITTTDLNGEDVAAQRCVVQNYHKNNIDSAYDEQDIGFRLDPIAIPINSGYQEQFGIIEGVIEIPRGPGVMVSMHESGAIHKTYLKGENYRVPTKFACAAHYTGDHSTSTSFVGNTYVSIGALPREEQPIVPSLADWGVEWRNSIREHIHDEFILHSITGSIVDHSYLHYTGIPANDIKTIKDLNVSYTDFPLNTVNSTPEDDKTAVDFAGFSSELSGFAGDEYRPLHRNSLLFEGWFRPYGLREIYTSGETVLAQALDTNSQGFKLYLGRSGEVKAQIDTTYHNAVSGGLGNATSPVTTYTLQSEDSIVWGDWNHIGIVLETNALGDEDEPASYPMFPAWDNHEYNTYTLNGTGERRNSPIYHAAKQAKLYLEVNENLSDQVEIEGPAYKDFYKKNASISPQNPRYSTFLQDWPKIPRFVGSGEFTFTMGSGIFCDFDHVRFSVRNHAEFLSDLLTKGSKATPPLISPQDAICPLPATTGDSSYLELMHVYRMDHPIDYIGLDDGLGTNHALLVGTTGSSALNAYNLPPEFFVKKVRGPRTRTAVRIGPGARLECPWNSMDEKVFNGSGSYDLTQARLYDNIAAISGRGYDFYLTGQGYQHERYSSNSHIRLGCGINFPEFPTTGIMDIMTYDENPALDAYGSGQVYLGITSGGELVGGTRYAFADDIGPLPVAGSRTILATGVWHHIGLDLAAREPMSGYGSFMQMYVSGANVYSGDLAVSNTGNSTITGGYPLGYGGYLDTDSNKSVYRIGGDLPRDNTSYDWTHRYGDYSVADWVVGYGIDHLSGASRWSWSGVAELEKMDKQLELAIANGSIINPVSGLNSYYSGHTTYPATAYSDAGEQLLWITANHGNQHEGLMAGGMSVFDDGIFLNARSYYAQYENDNAQQILGSTDSPIQIGNVVPNEGANLALVNVGNWTTDNSISVFDMSDSNPNNITQKIHGDVLLSHPNDEELGLTFYNAVANDNLRISSTVLMEHENPNKFVGYFMHVIGQPNKAVYIDGADPHLDAAADYEVYLNNHKKIKEAVQFKYANGDLVPFDVFPRAVYTSPYSASTDPDAITGYSIFGHSGINESIVNSDGLFSVVVVANKQTIGQSVFMHYPSKDYNTEAINLQDSETYNPVPLSKEILYPHRPDGTTHVISGYYSTRPGPGLNGFDVNIWYAHTGGFMGDTTALL